MKFVMRALTGGVDRKLENAVEENVKYRCGLSNGLSNEPSSNYYSQPFRVKIAFFQSGYMINTEQERKGKV